MKISWKWTTICPSLPPHPSLSTTLRPGTRAVGYSPIRKPWEIATAHLVARTHLVHRFSNFFQHFLQCLQHVSSLASSQHFPSIFWILWNPRGTPPGQGTCSPAAPVATRPARAPRCAAAVEWSSGNGSQSPGRPGATELENLPFIYYIYIYI